jgi:tetratricopeptide (TPR) repeat protein
MWPPFCLGQLALAQNDEEAAVTYFQEALAIAQPFGDPHTSRRVQAALAECDLLDGLSEQAFQRLVPLLDRPGEQEIQVTVLLPILAWAHLGVGDIQPAMDVIRTAITRARVQNLQVPLVDALRVQAMVLASQQIWPAAIDALDKALELSRGMPCPYAEAKTQYTYGQIEYATYSTG